MVAALYGSVDFTQILCDAETGHASPTGTGIPFTMAMAEGASSGGSGETLGARCGDPEKPNSVPYPHPHPKPSPSTSTSTSHRP